MKQSVHTVLKRAALSFAGLFFSFLLFAQNTPELVFRNPVVESGIAGQDGAQYRFENITYGIDGILKIKGRSSSSVELADIDVANLGWDKALQPQLGIRGNVPPNQTWWMQFELDFVKAGTTKKIKLNDFVATSIDVDGDGVSIREFVQMNKMKSMAYSSLTYLQTGSTLPGSLFSAMDADSDGDDHTFDGAGSDNMILGPVNNFTDIDTAATAVMATYTYENKDAITFVIGATSGSTISNAGLRLNSIWFKSFSLAPQKILPVKLESFAALYSNKAVTLNWKTASERDFSHFVIERSVDGKSYSDVALVFSAGGNSENEYSYKDKVEMLASSVVYYRLRMIDEDGSAAYSYVSAVHLNERTNIAVTAYPNPAASNVQVNLPGSWQGKTVQLKLYNGTGLVTINKQLKNASATTSLALSQLPAGFYIINASCNGETAQQRILKN